MPASPKNVLTAKSSQRKRAASPKLTRASKAKNLDSLQTEEDADRQDELGRNDMQEERFARIYPQEVYVNTLLCFRPASRTLVFVCIASPRCFQQFYVWQRVCPLQAEGGL